MQISEEEEKNIYIYTLNKKSQNKNSLTPQQRLRCNWDSLLQNFDISKWLYTPHFLVSFEKGRKITII